MNEMIQVEDKPDFRRELIDLINRHSVENESDTPDFILANYIIECLKVFEYTILARDKWYNFDLNEGK